MHRVKLLVNTVILKDSIVEVDEATFQRIKKNVEVLDTKKKVDKNVEKAVLPVESMETSKN